MIKRRKNKPMKNKVFLLIPAAVAILAIIGFGAQKTRADKNENCPPKKVCEEPIKKECPKKECPKKECKPCKEKMKEEPCPVKKECCPCEKVKTCRLPEPSPAPCQCAYNCPARVIPQCEWDVNFFGTFLYWKPQERALELAGKNNHTTSATSNLLVDTNINMDFDYKPAFKVGFGLNTVRDDWTTTFEYTRFKSKNNKSSTIDLANFDGSSLVEYWINSALYSELFTAIASTVDTANVARATKASWKLNFNLVDFALGRPYWLGTKLTLQPLVGVRGGWINQRFNMNNISPFHVADAATTTDFNIYYRGKLSSWLLGPRVGIGTNWYLGECGIRAFANASASLFYQHFKTTIKQNVPIQSVMTQEIEILLKHKIGLINPSFDALFGFGYGSYFNNNKWHFDFAVGYEFQFFYNQNAFKVEPRSVGDAAALSFQGLNVTAKFDF